MRHSLCWGRWLTLAAVSLWVWPLQAQVRAYTGATIIDGNGGPPLVQGVLLTEGAKITAVGAAGLVHIPAGAERVDLTGKYLVPGLIDGNVHLVPWPSWTYIECLARYQNNFDGIALEAAPRALKKGCPTLFESMGPARPEMRVRDRINRGEQVEPRLCIADDMVGFRAVFTTRASIAAASKALQARIHAQFALHGGQDWAWLTPDPVRVDLSVQSDGSAMPRCRLPYWNLATKNPFRLGETQQVSGSCIHAGRPRWSCSTRPTSMCSGRST